MKPKLIFSAKSYRDGSMWQTWISLRDQNNFFFFVRPMCNQKYL
jgi:hypothetical protein